MIVDLPVPLAPTRPTRSCDVISQSVFSKRSLWPKRFPAPESWIMGWNYRLIKRQYLVFSTENEPTLCSGRAWLQPCRLEPGNTRASAPEGRLLLSDGAKKSGVCCRPAVAAFRILAPQLAVEVNALQSAIDYRFQFMRVLHFAAFGQPLPRFFWTEPGGPSHWLIRPAHFVDFHQKGLHHKFLHAARLPEHALGVNVEMKMPRLDGADGTGLFRGLALGRL